MKVTLKFKQAEEILSLFENYAFDFKLCDSIKALFEKYPEKGSFDTSSSFYDHYNR